MRNSKSLIIFVLLAAGVMMAACAGSPAPATPVPSATSPQAVATAVPATASPTMSPTPAVSATNTPASGGGSSVDLQSAFAKSQAATAFRLEGQSQVSSSLFRGNYTPAPGDDPNQVVIFTLKGEQKSSDFHYTLGGFVGSFLALASGFDSTSNSVELTSVGGKQYARGMLTGVAEAKWYLLPDSSSSSGFDAKGLILPIVSAKYQNGDFTKTATENLDNHACDVFTANRSAFDSAFTAVSSDLLLTPDNFDLGEVDSFEFKLWACDDGNLHQVRYVANGHSKTNPEQKGGLTFSAHIFDYAAAIAIQAPTDAAPLPAGAFGAQPTETPTASPTSSAGSSTSPIVGYDGEWEGTSSTDSPIQFSIENNQVTSITINYAYNSGGCSIGGVYSGNPKNAPISGNAFAAEIADSDGVQYSISGTLTSDTEALGTIEVKGKTFCGDTDAKATWTAKHTRAGTGDNVTPTPEAPEASPTSESSGDAEKLVASFFLAVDTKNVDDAIADVSDDVIFHIGSTTGVGKEDLRLFLEDEVNKGIGYSASDVNSTDNYVTFTMQTTQASGEALAEYSSSVIFVEEGKISVLTLQ